MVVEDRGVRELVLVEHLLDAGGRNACKIERIVLSPVGYEGMSGKWETQALGLEPCSLVSTTDLLPSEMRRSAC